MLSSARKNHPKSAVFIRKSLSDDFLLEKSLGTIIDKFYAALEDLDSNEQSADIQDLWKFMVANVSTRNGKRARQMLAKACEKGLRDKNSGFLRALNLELLMTLKGIEAARGISHIIAYVFLITFYESVLP